MIDLAVGDVLEVLQNAANGWSKGRNTRTNASGWFPFAMTQEIPKPGAAAKAEESSEYYESESEEEAKPTPKQATAVQKQPVAAVAPSPRVSQPQAKQQQPVKKEEVEESYEEESDTDAKPNGEPNQASMNEITANKRKIERFNLKIVEIQKQLARLKAGEIPIIDLDISLKEQEALIKEENAELLEIVSSLEQQIKDSQKLELEAKSQQQQMIKQIQTFEKQQEQVLEFEQEKALLNQNFQEKLKEKDVQLQKLEATINMSSFQSEIDYKRIKQECISLLRERDKVAAESEKKEAETGGKQLVVTKRKISKAKLAQMDKM
ncbi:SH3_domain-containing protein [Hexamita inflata]|uniref:SH3 domain-containing protein n=1 Tax=Hexamita inflata TaxID=28002 RepID=A0AA86V2C6_9EUKA|nr:SH3 domain-containing protein [Hexamita inflata]